MGSKQTRTFFHVITKGIEINGERLPDLNVSGELREGEGVWEAIGRAAAEQQAPPPPKRVRAKVVKRLPKGGDK